MHARIFQSEKLESIFLILDPLASLTTHIVQCLLSDPSIFGSSEVPSSSNIIRSVFILVVQDMISPSQISFSVSKLDFQLSLKC